MLLRNRLPSRPTELVQRLPHKTAAQQRETIVQNCWQGMRRALGAASNASLEQLKTEHPLKAPVTWDGMAVAGGRLYLSTTDGRIACFAPSE